MSQCPALATVDECRLIELPKVPDRRGNLSFIEAGRHIPFAIERVYWVYDVPGGGVRGRHAYRELQECFVALSGSFQVHLDDGRRKRVVTLNRGYHGLYVPKLIWRDLCEFSTNAVCLVLASAPFTETDYIRDFDTFSRLRAGGG